MKLLSVFLGTATFCLLSFAPDDTRLTKAERYGLGFGDPEIRSISELAFGPEGILFMGDPAGAAIHALDTGEGGSSEAPVEFSIGQFDQKVASSLGTTPENIKIHDMAVHPVSKEIYFSVSDLEGRAVLLRVSGEELEAVPLKDVSFSTITLSDPVAENAADHRGRPLRVWAVSDLKYHKGKVLVSGLSNREFGSTFRSIHFPFRNNQDYASLEIFHAAHGQYETHAPIKTFAVVDVRGSDYLMASYTCTPLVLFPINELQAGRHVKGRTVAEMGYGNSPLDIVSYQKGGVRYYAMSNSNRPVMRMTHEDIVSTGASLSEPLPESEITAGMPYASLPMVHILQLDMLDEAHAVYLQRTAEGDLVLQSRPTKWM